MDKAVVYLILFATTCAVWGTLFVLMAAVGPEAEHGLKLLGAVFYGFSVAGVFGAYYTRTMIN